MASFTLGTTSANPGTNLQIKVTGSSTRWLPSTTFQFTGGTGATLQTQSVDPVNQVAWLLIYTGTASGTITIFESVDGPGTNASFTVNANPTFTLASASIRSTRRSRSRLQDWPRTGPAAPRSLCPVVPVRPSSVVTL